MFDLVTLTKHFPKFGSLALSLGEVIRVERPSGREREREGRVRVAILGEGTVSTLET